MKKYVSILLSLVMVFSIMSVSVFATEIEDNPDNVVTISAPIEAETTGAENTDDGTQSTEPVVEEEEENGYLKGKIIAVEDVTEENVYGMYTIKTQPVTVQILNGKHANEEHESTYYLTKDINGMFEDEPLKVGDNVYIQVGEEEDTETGEQTVLVAVVQKMRDTNLLVIALLVAVVLLVIGTISGVRTLGLIVANVAIVMACVCGLYLNGISALLSLLTLVVAIIIANTLIINGFKKESWVAILSIFISTVITIGVFMLMNNWLSVIGMTEYGNFLNGANPELIKFNYLDILVAGTMIMSLGVTIDIGLRAVKKGSQGKSFGITVKEIAKKLPERTNIVFLAWFGAFITMFVVFFVYQIPFLEIVNQETVIVEAAKILIMFVNVLLVIPVAALLSKELLKTRSLVEPKEEE